jgi:hypothetical protein
MQKNVNINGVWTIVELTEDEKEKVLSKLLDSNMKELLRCRDAVFGNEDFKEMDSPIKSEVIKLLFDKQATASYTALQEALDIKVKEMRGKCHKTPNIPKEQEVEINKYVEGQLKKEDQKQGKSVIEKAFETTGEHDF